MQRGVFGELSATSSSFVPFVTFLVVWATSYSSFIEEESSLLIPSFKVSVTKGALFS